MHFIVFDENKNRNGKNATVAKHSLSFFTTLFYKFKILRWKGFELGIT